MTRLLLVSSVLALSSFAMASEPSESKVLCSSYGASNLSNLIAVSVRNGFTVVSAPAVAMNGVGQDHMICVTVTKPEKP